MARGDVTHAGVTSGGRTVAWCDIELARSDHEAHARLGVASGHLPIGVRHAIVDRTMQCLQDAGVARLHLTVPRGEGEVIQLFSQRCARLRVWPAGSTCLIDAELAPPARHRR
ncbi:MAG TPA: hypothetical protein VE441_12780 [Mycobacterium sp.]|jgi:hypothetical protein|nr:hypothetical protein [Mycobacterium sp.]